MGPILLAWIVKLSVHFITKLLDIKGPNIKSVDIINMDPQKGNHWINMIFKRTKIPYLECAGYKILIRLRKLRFRCKICKKMAVAETPLVKKNQQIPRIINQKIAQKLIEKTSMTDIAYQLAISTSTVIRKLNDFSRLHKTVSWDEYAFKMSFIRTRL